MRFGEFLRAVVLAQVTGCQRAAACINREETQNQAQAELGVTRK
jgi:hypothetical protein